MNKSKWEIWWAEVRYEDEPEESKIRPVLVLDDKESFLVSFKITSKLYHKGYRIVLWEDAGLKVESMIILKRIRISDKDFHGKIGKLQQRDIIGLTEYMRENF